MKMIAQYSCNDLRFHHRDARLRHAVDVRVSSVAAGVGVGRRAAVVRVDDVDELVGRTRDRQRTLVLAHDASGGSEAAV